MGEDRRGGLHSELWERDATRIWGGIGDNQRALSVPLGISHIHTTCQHTGAVHQLSATTQQQLAAAAASHPAGPFGLPLDPSIYNSHPAVVQHLYQKQLELLHHNFSGMVVNLQREIEADRRENQRAAGLLEGRLEAKFDNKLDVLQGLSSPGGHGAGMVGGAPRSAAGGGASSIRVAATVGGGQGGARAAAQQSSRGQSMGAITEGGVGEEGGVSGIGSGLGEGGSISLVDGDDNYLPLKELEQRIKIVSLEAAERDKKTRDMVKKLEHFVVNSNSQVRRSSCTSEVGGGCL